VTSQKKKTRKRREKVLASREKVFEIRTNQHKNTKTQKKKKRKKKRKENESSLLCSQSLFLNNWLGFRWALNCLAVTKNRRSIY
jgi:hypothetical protein